MFNFLWSGKKEKEGMNLSNWKNISKPRKVGGWGIKNIFFFGKALAVKILCRCLMFSSLWHEVIMKKYLKKNTVGKWFGHGRKNWNRTSNFWRALTSLVNIISGEILELVLILWLISHSFYKLTENILLMLKDQGIISLAHAGTNA